MANDCQENLRLRKKENFLRQFRDEKSKEFVELTATQFTEIWSHYDRDGKNERRLKKQRRKNFHFHFDNNLGNGFIEGRELDDFLRELVASMNHHDSSPDVKLHRFVCLFSHFGIDF